MSFEVSTEQCSSIILLWLHCGTGTECLLFMIQSISDGYYQVPPYISFSYLFLSLFESEISRSVEVQWVANVIFMLTSTLSFDNHRRSKVALNEVSKFRESDVWIHKACSRFEMYPKAPSVELYHPRSESYHPYLGVRVVSSSRQGVLC